jgi:hypothetical protein
MESGDAVLDLTAGSYLLSYRSIDGWGAPADQNVTVTAGLTEAHAPYTCLSGDVDAWYAPGWDIWG